MSANRGYTKRQREWFKRVYNARCHFPLYSEDKGFYYCGDTKEIHIHHTIPKGWYVHNIGNNPNFPGNGIALCARHHIGKGYKGTLDWYTNYVPVIHPDIEWARRRYEGTNESFNRVFEGRLERIINGETYWNTDFDEMLRQITDWVTHKYQLNNPLDQFPYRKGIFTVR